MAEYLELVLSGINVFVGVSQITSLLVGVVLGILIGVLPGMGPLLGVVLAIPFTFYMDAVSGMALLLGIYQGGSFGGAISAAVLGIPGTPIAASTLLDARPMALSGRTSEAVSLSTVASSFGGVVSGFVLMLAAPPLAELAMRFGPAETFAMAVLGLACVASLSQESLIKGALSVLLGLAVATIGTDPITGFPRYTFGVPSLVGGVTLVALLVGVFAISEVLMQFGQSLSVARAAERVTPVFSTIWSIGPRIVDYLRASAIGTFIGSIPGVGGVSASFLAYSVAKNASSQPDRFGSGIREGVIATEAANNATCGGAMIPMLALGIPGDPIVAALMGGLLIQGLTPGPSLFLYNADVVAGIFVAFLIGAFLILPIGFLGISLFVQVLRLPRGLLYPGVLLLSIVGTYAVQGSVFDIWTMWVFGAVGYAMRKGGYPLAPLVIGFVLGPIVESNLRRTLMLTEGHVVGFLSGRPIALAILAVALLFVLWPFLRGWSKRMQPDKRAA